MHFGYTATYVMDDEGGRVHCNSRRGGGTWQSTLQLTSWRGGERWQGTLQLTSSRGKVAEYTATYVMEGEGCRVHSFLDEPVDADLPFLPLAEDGCREDLVDDP